jgi:monomeric sarcosine oxidase
MKYDVVIIGAGVMGAATAYYLSKVQKNILLLDQYEVQNNRNSSQDHSRVFRYEYGTDEFYSTLAVESLKLWKEVEKESDTQLYFKCGCLLLGKTDDTYAMKSYRTMKKLGLPIELLDRKDFHKRFPQFNSEGGVLDPNGGVIEANTATNTFVALAQKNGVQVRTNTKVIDIDDKSVVLDTGEKIHAGKIVVTAGVWNTKLLKNKITVIPSRQELIYFQPKNQEMFQKDKFPTFGHLESGFYGIPIHRINAVKIANHFPGEPVDPDTVDRNATEEFITKCREFLKQYIPDLADTKVIETKVCLYDMTKNEDFILDKLTENIIIGAGFSGHGFKFAPVIGKILADLTLIGKTTYDISRFRLQKN